MALPGSAAPQAGGAALAFSINYDTDDNWWVAVPPGTTDRAGRPAHLQATAAEPPADAEQLDRIEVHKFDYKSHCYTVVSGGKAYDVCPAH